MKKQEFEIGDLVRLTGADWWGELKDSVVLLTTSDMFGPAFINNGELYYVNERWAATIVSKVYKP